MNSKAIQFMNDFQMKMPHSKIYIVGGAVRDFIMGLVPHDYDFATNVYITEIEKHFNCVDIGQSKDFGITSVQYEGENFEVATFRQDSEYSNNRHPKKVSFQASIVDDLSRRDFTMNSIAMGISGDFFDPFDGYNDIQNKILRCVGNAQDRFEEDALRMMRAIRFAVVFDLTLHNDIIEAIKIKRNNINNLSQERITQELTKVGSKGGKVFFKYLKLLEDVDLMSIIFPEIWDMRNFNHAYKHHPEGAIMWDCVNKEFRPLSLKAIETPQFIPHKAGTVYDHVMACMSKLDENDNFDVIMSTLYHDIGKPKTALLKDVEFMTHSFKMHEHVGKYVWDEICKKRKFNNSLKEVVKFCIEKHMIANNFDLQRKSAILEIGLSPYFEILKRVCYADDSSRGEEIYDEQKFIINMEKIEKFKKIYIDENKFKDKVQSFINGDKVKSIRNIVKPSKEIGDIIKHVTDILIERDFNITQAEVDEIIATFVVK